MLVNDASLLGMVAGTLTTVAFVPQVLKTWRSKSAGDVSYAATSAMMAAAGLKQTG